MLLASKSQCLHYLSAGHKKRPLERGGRCGEVAVSGGSNVLEDYSMIAREMILLTILSCIAVISQTIQNK